MLLIDIELSYINTNHEDFIGFAKYESYYPTHHPNTPHPLPKHPFPLCPSSQLKVWL